MELNFQSMFNVFNIESMVDVYVLSSEAKTDY